MENMNAVTGGSCSPLEDEFENSSSTQRISSRPLVDIERSVGAIESSLRNIAQTSSPPVTYRLVGLTFGAAPFDCCLLEMPPLACPLAAPAAVLALSAFLLLSAAAFFSLPSLRAACRAAVRASGR